MQAWHCLVIITITLCLFAFGMFRKDIVENTEYLKIENGYVNDNQSQKTSTNDQAMEKQQRNQSTLLLEAILSVLAIQNSETEYRHPKRFQSVGEIW